MASAGMKEVVQLIQHEQWELGYAMGSRDDGRFWVQEGGLTRGGKTKNVSAATIRALERRGLIEVVPKRPGQPFWLRRYQFKPAGAAQKGRG